MSTVGAGPTAIATPVLVAGTAGGVGTTTVTALLFAALAQRAEGAPLLFDHSAGELGLRLAEGDDVGQVDPALALHDLGPHGGGAAVFRLADPGAVLVLVAPATPAGCLAADRVLTTVSQRHGNPGLRRVVVAGVGVFGRHRITSQLGPLRERLGSGQVLVVGRDRALAAGGRIPLVRLDPQTVRAQQQLAAVLLERAGSPRRG